MSTKTSQRVYNLFKQDIGQRSLSDNERLNLFRAAQAGDRAALNLLIKDNAGLVIRIAWRYADQDDPWLTINDLIQEGCMGMTRAIKKFDPSKGKFSDYAGYWIRQHISIYLARNERFVSLPREVHDLVLRHRRLSVLFQAENGHYPDEPDEIGFTEKEAKIIKRAERTMISDFDLDDCENVDDVDYVYYSQVRVSLEKAIDTLLTDKETEVIRARWLNGSQPTHLEVADRLGVSKQAIADREKRALRKLKEGLATDGFLP